MWDTRISVPLKIKIHPFIKMKFQNIAAGIALTLVASFALYGKTEVKFN